MYSDVYLVKLGREEEKILNISHIWLLILITIVNFLLSDLELRSVAEIPWPLCDDVDTGSLPPKILGTKPIFVMSSSKSKVVTLASFAKREDVVREDARKDCKPLIFFGG